MKTLCPKVKENVALVENWKKKLFWPPGINCWSIFFSVTHSTLKRMVQESIHSSKYIFPQNWHIHLSLTFFLEKPLERVYFNACFYTLQVATQKKFFAAGGKRRILKGIFLLVLSNTCMKQNLQSAGEGFTQCKECQLYYGGEGERLDNSVFF